MMIKKKTIFLLMLFASTFHGFSQRNNQETETITLKGQIIDKDSNTPLEYASITFVNPQNVKKIFGGITNKNGEFSVEIIPGTYDAKAEFVSYKNFEIKQKEFTKNTSLGKILLQIDSSQLDEVIIRSEKTNVEIKLDKKIYNIGKDLMVKGGTVSDVLDNIPSISVANDGTISVRGNDNIKIYIDGRPSNAVDISTALRQLPADAIDKVEVVTNPSSRYDAEGGGGILNIVLKKGKNLGLNGSVGATLSNPNGYSANASVNYKTKKINFFTTDGFSNRQSPGRGLTNSQYFDNNKVTTGFVDENTKTKRKQKNVNIYLGAEWLITPSAIWTNSYNYSNNNGTSNNGVEYFNYDENQDFTFGSERKTISENKSNDQEYSSNFIKNFNKNGHKLTIDGSYSKNTNGSLSSIFQNNVGNTGTTANQDTYNNRDQTRLQLQADYVLPMKKGKQFEAGYKGSFSELNNDYSIPSYNANSITAGLLNYKERINAVYVQYGFKVSKLSVLLGSRFENSNINIDQLATSDFNKKYYNNLFPSIFLSYAFSGKSDVAVSYSKRISRPRGRLINPFVDYSSNINIFKGNPDLNPSLTDKFNLEFIHRWSRTTFNTAIYYENTKNIFAFVRLESGAFVNNIPVIMTTPINLGIEQRSGMELTLNSTPLKWLRVNGNLNFFNLQTNGDYSYTSYLGDIVNQQFDYQSFGWTGKISSRISLPYQVEWQTNYSYNSPRTNAQGKSLGMNGVNVAFSKDFFKEKATLALNVSDIFNSRIMKTRTYSSSFSSYSEMQFRTRQINLSFTYRFNKKKGDKDKKPKENGEDGMEGST